MDLRLIDDFPRANGVGIVVSGHDRARFDEELQTAVASRDLGLQTIFIIPVWWLLDSDPVID